MKLVIISLGIFLAMKLVYNFWGNYYNVHWDMVYYIVNNTMMCCIFWFMYLYSESQAQRYFFLLAVAYFFGLMILHIVCMFSAVTVGYITIENLPVKVVKSKMYDKCIAGNEYFGVGSIILTIGILYIRYKLKKPCRKNLDKKPYS